MTNTPPTFIAITVLTVDSPAGAEGTWPAMTHLAAIAMLIVKRDPAGGWTFALKHQAIGAGTGEGVLLAWAADVMPDHAIAIGWQIADMVVTPLLEAAREGDPDIATAFLARLAKLVTAPSIDLAVPHGGAGAPPLKEVAAHRGIELAALSPGQVESAWAFGNVGWLCDEADAQAIACLRLWLAEANGTAEAPSEAFEAWLANRSG